MSWRSRKHRSYRKSYQSKFFFSEKEIDFTTEYLDYDQFLLQEFFTADKETKQNLSFYYIETYGSLSYSYLNRKYSEWANGNYHLTDLMRGRITSVMPKFLNDEAKHKLGVHEYMSSIKSTIKKYQTNQKSVFKNSTSLNQTYDLESIFKKEKERINALSIQNFKFNILTEEEKYEALEISKYILEDKLQKTFDHIERDFNTFLPFMKKFKPGSFSATYSIGYFRLNIDISNTAMQDIKLPKSYKIQTQVNSRFKEYSNKYLAYELVSMQNESNKAISKSFLNENDIQLFVQHYEDLLNGESEVKMNSTFSGEGGVLSIKAEMKPLKLLKTSIIISVIKLAIYILVIFSLVLLGISLNIFGLLIFGGIVLCILAYNLMGEEIRKLKLLTKEIKTYGK